MSHNYIIDPLPVTNHGERHVPVVLLLDISGSMTGRPIDELNQGLIEFQRALQADSLALGRAEICVITFNSKVNIDVGFTPAAEYSPSHLSASGGTSMNEAILAGLEEIENRIALYKAQGVNYYRPWIFLLTDGAATDTAKEYQAMNALRTAVENKKVLFMPMGIGAGADRNKLREYYPESAASKPVLTANANNFKETFVWLSRSVGVVTASDPNVTDQVQLPPPPASMVIDIGTAIGS